MKNYDNYLAGPCTNEFWKIPLMDCTAIKMIKETRTRFIKRRKSTENQIKNKIKNKRTFIKRGRVALWRSPEKCKNGQYDLTFVFVICAAIRRHFIMDRNKSHYYNYWGLPKKNLCKNIFKSARDFWGRVLKIFLSIAFATIVWIEMTFFS